jgi:hypothetical protein
MFVAWHNLHDLYGSMFGPNNTTETLIMSVWVQLAEQVLVWLRSNLDGSLLVGSYLIDSKLLSVWHRWLTVTRIWLEPHSQPIDGGS